MATEDHVDPAKAALTSYFASQADEGMDRLWEAGKRNDQKNEEILKEHLRMPYHGESSNCLIAS